MYKPYPKYKKSGVAWLEDVPEGWGFNTFRRGISILTDFESNGSFADVKKNVSLDTNDKYAWYLRATDLEGKRKAMFRTCDKKSFDFLKKTVLYGEELLIAKRGEIGKIYIVPKLKGRATLAPNLYLIRMNKILYSKFAYYWFLSDFGKPELLLANKSTTIGALYKDDVRECKMIYPPFKEQKQIVYFLDQKTQKIDTLIAKQQQLIELLKEKRQAVISHVVTKGLDDSVTFKDSGVAWLGAVPEGWEVKQVKYLLNDNIGIKIGPFGSSLKLENMVKKGYKVYGQENVIKSNFLLGHRYISEEKFNTMIVYKVELNDILITMMGTIGKCIVVPNDIEIGIIDSHLIKIRTNQLILPDYFTLMIDKSEIVKIQLELNSKGSIMQGLNSTIIKNLIFPLPSISEQIKILTYLDQKTTQIDSLINKATKAIELLKERRVALVSAVVTGKIDVRDHNERKENEL